jgi:hypothetical protein
MTEPRDSCILHHKLENNTDTSEIGPDPAWTGSPSFDAAKFGNGVSGITSSDYVTFTDATTECHEWSLGFYWVPSQDYGTFTTNEKYLQFNESGEEFSIIYNQNRETFDAYFWESSYKSYYRFTPIDFDAGDKIHLYFVFSSSASDTNRIKCYQDGSELSQDDIFADLAWSFSEPKDMRIWSNLAGAWTSIIDNLKIYNSNSITTEVLANLGNEGFPSATKPRAIIN